MFRRGIGAGWSPKVRKGLALEPLFYIWTTLGGARWLAPAPPIAPVLLVDVIPIMFWYKVVVTDTCHVQFA